MMNDWGEQRRGDAERIASLMTTVHVYIILKQTRGGAADVVVVAAAARGITTCDLRSWIGRQPVPHDATADNARPGATVAAASRRHPRPRRRRGVRKPLMD